MLVALSIRDIVLIDKLDLGFEKGFTVFTGETGAGKSIILDSLSLALGARGDGGLVRRGATSASVTASFDLNDAHPAMALLAEQGFDSEDTLILRRVQGEDGRTKAFINDRPVSTGLLKQLGKMLVEIHGQHDDRALLDSATHRHLLDQFGGLIGEVQEVSRLWEAWREKNKAVDELEKALAVAEREKDYLTAACEELNQLAPQPGEEDDLATRRASIVAAQKARADLEDIADALNAPQFPAAKLSAALRRLERTPNIPDALKPIQSALERVLIEAEEARELVEAQLRGESGDNVEAIEERLFRLRAVARKYRVTVNDLPAVHARFREDLGRIETGEEDLAGASKAAAEFGEVYARAADALSEKRRATATLLDAAVQAELAPLKLDKARFVTEIEPMPEDRSGLRGGPFGREQAMFYVQTNPGAKPGPLMKVASGGELARFLLALKVVLAEKATAPVLVFDEIDTGVGGATAAAIGERQARLGTRAQVLAVTHSPQVAANADQHIRLHKAARGEGDAIVVTTSAEVLSMEGRREEIARMLAGKEVTAEARAAAESLIGARHVGAHHVA
ncbi:DNA repair protein RecN [Rhodomicrobium vannielii ATCC 17100]|uniref:DNA repair protein RecN n=1 Tax=Rhodomicrobium vannielii (strain ATCC 17100 / DSM 162 / LMG 4299 / NCIMB 10020 / ATH 3.1.1) TaxID=648757 RepID=E3I230_RHOVT|nr:DNA repair protein RecN [Rhodomicrobium vannielii]ADP71331.1 DNA repair protein RecN [Rhodomicrobium vannielii ATCC 17100]